MKLSGICPSVCPIIRSPHAAAVGLLLWARRAGDIGRLLHGRQAVATASSVMLSADEQACCERRSICDAIAAWRIISCYKQMAFELRMWCLYE